MLKHNHGDKDHLEWTSSLAQWSQNANWRQQMYSDLSSYEGFEHTSISVFHFNLAILRDAVLFFFQNVLSTLFHHFLIANTFYVSANEISMEQTNNGRLK